MDDVYLRGFCSAVAIVTGLIVWEIWQIFFGEEE